MLVVLSDNVDTDELRGRNPWRSVSAAAGSDDEWASTGQPVVIARVQSDEDLAA